MPKVKLEIELLDKKQSFPGLHAEYDTETRIAIVRRGLGRHVANKFEIDPDHIHEKIVNGRIAGAKVYVDNALRKSVPMKKEDGEETENVEVAQSADVASNGEIDGKKKNSLDYLIEEVFWKALIAKNKIPLSTILIMFMAGGGIFFLIRDIVLPIFGVHS